MSSSRSPILDITSAKDHVTTSDILGEDSTVPLWLQTTHVLIQCLAILAGLPICAAAIRRLCVKNKWHFKALQVGVLCCCLAECLLLCPVKIARLWLQGPALSWWIWTDLGLSFTVHNIFSVISLLFCFARIYKLKHIFKTATNKKSKFWLYSEKLMLILIATVSIGIAIYDSKKDISGYTFKDIYPISLDSHSKVFRVSVTLTTSCVLFFGYIYCLVWVRKRFVRVIPKASNDAFILSLKEPSTHIPALEPRDCSFRFSQEKPQSNHKLSEANRTKASKCSWEESPALFVKNSNRNLAPIHIINPDVFAAGPSRNTSVTLSTCVDVVPKDTDDIQGAHENKLQDNKMLENLDRDLPLRKVLHQGWCGTEDAIKSPKSLNSPKSRRNSGQKSRRSSDGSKIDLKLSVKITALETMDEHTIKKNDSLTRKSAPSKINISSQISVESASYVQQDSKKDSLQVGTSMSTHDVSPTDIFVKRFKYSFQGKSAYFNPMWTNTHFPYMARIQGWCVIYILLHFLFLLPSAATYLLASSHDAHILADSVVALYTPIMLLVCFRDRK